MNSLDKMKLRTQSISLREEKIHTTKQYIDIHFQDDPTYQKNGIQIANGRIIYPRLFNYKKEDNLSPTIEIQTQICDEFKRGQLLEINDQYWLCLKSYCFNNMYWIGKLKQCTHLLKWQDNKTHEIKTSWAVLERPYSRTLNEGKIITISEMEFKARLPFNEDTEKINLDKRLLTGTEYDQDGNMIGSVYKITGRDASSQVINGVGFLILNMVQDVYNRKKDNIALGICDYTSISQPTPPPTPNPTLLQCEILGRQDIKIGGSTRIYTAKFYKDDGSEDTAVVPIWNLKVNPFYKDYIKYEQNGNLINITCLDNGDLIGESLTLELVDKDGVYQKTKRQIECVAM